MPIALVTEIHSALQRNGHLPVSAARYIPNLTLHGLVCPTGGPGFQLSDHVLYEIQKVGLVETSYVSTRV